MTWFPIVFSFLILSVLITDLSIILIRSDEQDVREKYMVAIIFIWLAWIRIRAADWFVRWWFSYIGGSDILKDLPQKVYHLYPRYWYLFFLSRSQYSYWFYHLSLFEFLKVSKFLAILSRSFGCGNLLIRHVGLIQLKQEIFCCFEARIFGHFCVWMCAKCMVVGGDACD